MNKLAQGVNIGTAYGSPWGVSSGYTLGNLVSIIVSNAIMIAGIIVLFLFVYGGLSMIMGAGNDNPQTAAKGKAAVTNAAIGFFIVFSAYFIVRIVEAITGLRIL